MHDFLFQFDEISRLTNQRNNIWIIVCKFAKFLMIFFLNLVFFYSRLYLFQSLVYHTLFFNHVVRKISLNHISRDFSHFLACFNDQRRIINIIRFRKKEVKNDHFDEIKRRDREDKFQRASKNEKNSNWD
jgi:hypothetical protein